MPDREELIANLNERRMAFVRILTRNISLWRERIQAAASSYGFQRVPGRIGEERLRLEEQNRRMELSLSQIIYLKRKSIDALKLQLAALSPDAVLNRGYCVARSTDGTVVRDSSVLHVNDELKLRFQKGSVVTLVKEVWQNGR